MALYFNGLINCLLVKVWITEWCFLVCHLNSFLTAIRCSSLSPPVNGSLSGSKFSYNKSVVYSCNRGYNLENGNKIRTCLMSGHWSGKAPSCQREYFVIFIGRMLALIFGD